MYLSEVLRHQDVLAFAQSAYPSVSTWTDIFADETLVGSLIRPEGSPLRRAYQVMAMQRGSSLPMSSVALQEPTVSDNEIALRQEARRAREAYEKALNGGCGEG